MKQDYQRSNDAFLTKWGKNIDPEHVLEEYPRPGLRRNSYINLNGYWNYAITAEETPLCSKRRHFSLQYDGKILVPFSPEAPLSGVNRILRPDQFLHYERHFEFHEADDRFRLLLHFGAVDCICTVYVNQREAGRHTGGYLPFSFDITEYVQEGDNVLRLVVRDPSDTSYHAKGKQSLDRGGMWYTPQSGIWQTVWMEEVPKQYIAGLKLDQDFDEGSLRIRVMMNGKEKLPVRLAIRLNGKDIAEAEGTTGSSVKVVIPDFLPWTPETPVLYDLAVRAGEDEVLSYFAMRKISMEKDRNGIWRMFLNNRPYYQNGVLDQGYYPDGLYTAPSDEAMVNDILQMKALGFNMLRKHIKIEPDRWYYHCDRLGMLVWQDMVCGGEKYKGWFVTTMPNLLPVTGRLFRDSHRRLFSRENETGREEFIREVRQTVRHLYHHPSIVLWVPFNEGWGQFDANKAAALIKKLDPSRLVDEASGWFDQGGGDVCSIHNYFRTLKVRPEQNRCIALTEFGGYSWHMPDHSWCGQEYGYKKYHSREELTGGIEKLWKRDLISNVGKGLSASVYTQVSDVEDETNGFLTYDREKLKVDASGMAQMNRQLYEAFEKETGQEQAVPGE